MLTRQGARKQGVLSTTSYIFEKRRRGPQRITSHRQTHFYRESSEGQEVYVTSYNPVS